MCLWPYAIWWLFCLSPSVWWGTYVRRRWMLLCLFVFAGLFLPFLRALLVLNKQWRFLEKLSDYYRFSVIQLKIWRVQVCNNGILLPKLFWPTYCEKKKILVIEKKLLKFEAESREYSNFLRSLEQFIQTVKGQNNFWWHAGKVRKIIFH